jgi:hypothetical protein
MDNLHLLTVATHDDGYYKALKISAKRNNYNLETLGWGQKWTGFIMRIKLYIDKLNTFDDNDIVIIIDAYDVIILENKDVLIQKFKKFDKAIILSRDPDANNILSKYLQTTIFHKSHNYKICAGLMMGYAWALKKLFYLMCGDTLEKCKKDNLDDQLLLINTFYDKNNKDFIKKNIMVDYNSEIFLNTFGNTAYLEFDFEITDIFYIKNTKLYLKNTDINPCIIHGPGSTNLNSVCNYYNLPIAKKMSRKSIDYRLNLYYKPQYIEKFSDDIFKVKLFIIIMLITFTGLYIKDTYFRS